MSRPAAPSWIVPTFATDANYPAGSDPWAGTPTKVIFSGATGGFVPGQSAAAQYVNYHFNAAYTVEASVKAYNQALLDAFGQAYVHSWSAETYPDLGVASTEVRSPLWDPVRGAWFVAYQDTGGQRAAHSFDGGRTWNSHSYFTSASLPVYLGNNPAGLLVAVDGANNLAWYNNTPGSTTWTAVTLSGLAAVTRFCRINWFVPTSQFIAVGGTGTPTSKMIRGNGTSNWADVSASIPAAINAQEKWTQDVSPTLFCAIPRVTAGVNYMTSTDLITFTQRTSLPSVAGFWPAALKYNAAEALWMVVYNNASGNIRVYTNPDPVAGTWTLKFFSSFGQCTVYSASLAVSGSLWLLSGIYDGSTASQTRYSGLYSVDSGVTWRSIDMYMSTTAIANPETFAIAEGGGRFMVVNGEKLVYSSQAIGLRPAVT